MRAALVPVVQRVLERGRSTSRVPAGQRADAAAPARDALALRNGLAAVLSAQEGALDGDVAQRADVGEPGQHADVIEGSAVPAAREREPDLAALQAARELGDAFGLAAANERSERARGSAVGFEAHRALASDLHEAPKARLS